LNTDIETLLFKQVSKPKYHLMTKVIHLWDNRYRINVYTETERDGLMRRKIANSYFCHHNKDVDELVIIPDKDTNRIKNKWA